MSELQEHLAVVYHDATPTIDWQAVPNPQRFRYAGSVPELVSAVEAAADQLELIVIDAEIEPRHIGEVARLMRSASAEAVLLRKEKAWISAPAGDGKRRSYALEANDIPRYLVTRGLRYVDLQPAPRPVPATSALAMILPPYDSLRSKEQLALIADDDWKSREHSADLMRNLGFSVVLARTGMQAVRLARSLKPSTVLLDGLMPELHGFEVARLIRHIDARYTPRILAVTAIYKGIRYQNDAKLRYGFDAYLIKPLTPEVITAALWGAAA